MENLYFDRKKDVEHYIDEHKVKLLGVGKEGECTLLDNGYAVKLFHYPKDLDYALRLKGIKNGSLQIVEAAAIVNDEAHATFAINAPGKDLYEHAPMNQTFEIMGEQLNVLAADLRKAGNKGIRIKDSFTGNIVYDYSKFTIIDTSSCDYEPGQKFAKDNMEDVLGAIYARIFGDFIWFNPTYDLHWKRNKKAISNPLEYMKLLRSRIVDYTDKDVRTFKEAKQAVLKRIG